MGTTRPRTRAGTEAGTPRQGRQSAGRGVAADGSLICGPECKVGRVGYLDRFSLVIVEMFGFSVCERRDDYWCVGLIVVLGVK